MSLDLTGACWFCSAPLSALDYGRGDTCQKCGRDTKVCKGCIFYDRTYNNECRESQAERVVEKERSNFCDYFKPSNNKAATSASSPSPKDLARAAAEALFKKK